MKAIIENKAGNYGKTTAGIIILTLGSLLLIDQLGLFAMPAWLFSWPMWLLAWGVYMGGKQNFRGQGWVLMVFLGIAFFFSENVNNADAIIWPMVIIISGLWMVYKYSRKTIA